VAAQLTASQEGLSSMELVNFSYGYIRDDCGLSINPTGETQ
jgi:hypothetical protein